MKKQLFLLNLNNWQFLTICKSINSEKIKISLILILSNALILEK